MGREFIEVGSRPNGRCMARIGVAAAGCALVVAVTTAAVPASAGSAPELRARTVVAGPTTAAVEVVLPRKVRISTNTVQNSFASVSATGPIAGVVVRQTGVEDPAEVVALSIDPCSPPPCTEDRLEVTAVRVPGTLAGARATHLPRGRYVVYLIAEEGSVRAKLTLPGLGGKTTLRPTSPAAASFGELDPGITGTTGATFYQATAEHAVPRGGFSVVAFELDVSPHLIGNYGSCIARAEAGIPPAVTGNTCARNSGAWTFVYPDPEGGRLRGVSLSMVVPGEYVHSVSVRSATVPREVFAFGFALSFTGAKGRAGYSGTGFSYDERS